MVQRLRPAGHALCCMHAVHGTSIAKGGRQKEKKALDRTATCEFCGTALSGIMPELNTAGAVFVSPWIV